MASPMSCQQFLYLHVDWTPPPAKARETVLPGECETVALRCLSATDHAEARSVRICQFEDASQVPGRI